jgi:hypothetical protein
VVERAGERGERERVIAGRAFDITPDGKQIVIDRLRENSDIVMSSSGTTAACDKLLEVDEKRVLKGLCAPLPHGRGSVSARR